VDANTIFRVGSVTKLVTTLMLFKLRDAGMLSLDDPIHVHDSLPSCEC
jgi:CubicO group peptidase (beta-lactamase class C family)